MSTSFLLSGLKFGSVLAQNQMLRRTIPSSGESLPIIGLGTSRVFDVDPEDREELKIRKEIIEVLLNNGGSLVDTSPMYGQSEDLLGQILDDYPRRNELFLATKVWIKGKPEGEQQISESFKKMNTAKMELIQIHNLVDWKTQIKTLRQMKESGEISYIGITHYKSSAFKEMEDIIKKEPIDFAQFNYSIGERDAEERLLPICQEFGVATIINRPFMRGKLFRSFKNQTLPDWCKDYDINSWGQFFLKYIIANPAVTNIIPATSKSKNMLDNSIAGMGRVTDLKIQKRMLEML
jgi:diketogulonate reductase-like aldo/keto reductase|tara:strand:+ start:215 stop:1093 length:879 start_codon:yes stop_codon:yes gene_type:complete